MGNRRIIFLLLCGNALCAALLWLLQQGRHLLPVKSKPPTHLVDTPLDDVERVTVERGSTRIGLKRDGGLWRLTAPFSAQVEQAAVERLLDAFEAARVVDVLSFQEIRGRELSLRDFGLEPARMQVVLERGTSNYAFLIGGRSPTGRECYLRVNGSEEVLVAPAGLLDAIPVTADALRSRALLRGQRAMAQSLEVRSPGQPYIALSRRESGAWQLTQPALRPASSERVEALLDLLREAQVVQFVWPSVSNVMDVAEGEAALRTRMGIFGLDEESGTHISVQMAGAAEPVSLVFGRPLEGDATLAYLLLPRAEAIGAISNSVAQAFRLALDDLRNVRPFDGAAAGVRRLQIRMDGLKYVLTQTNATWRFDAPFTDVADQAAVREALDRLLRLQALNVEDADTWRQSHELEQSQPVSEVELHSDQGVWRFTAQPCDMHERQFDLILADAPVVYRVSCDDLPAAFTSFSGLTELRGRVVLALPRDTLRRIAARREGRPDGMAERDSAAGAWRLAEGSGRLDLERLEKLAQALENLNADRIEAMGLAQDLYAKYGLHDPWLELSVDVEARDAVRKVLLVGREVGFGKRYAAVRGLDVIFVLDTTALETLATRFVVPVE